MVAFSLKCSSQKQAKYRVKESKGEGWRERQRKREIEGKKACKVDDT